MKKSELVGLFMTMKRAYPNFDANPDNVDFWYRYLHNVPLELAEANLDRHIATERFPPVIADLSRRPDAVEEVGGQYVPSVEETRQMLDKQAESKGSLMPDWFREEMRAFANRQSTAGH